MDDQIEKYTTQAMDWEIQDENRSLNDVELTSWMDARKGWIEKERDKGNMLRHKARIEWDVEGDENSKFFHLMIRRRYNRNNIRGLLVNGVWCEDRLLIKGEMFRFYKNIFSNNQRSRPKIKSNQITKLSEKEANSLEVPFTKHEVWEAICGCGGDKSPGPYGFNFSFIRTFWNIIKNEILMAVKWFWEHIEISKGYSTSFVTLIPKKKKGLISKVGFEKVYDSVSWSFLGDMMETMGFGCKWHRWIMACFHSASMSILVNASRTDEFVLEIGIRQGDPLSPFLFILAAKGLNAIVSEAVSYGVLRGINVGIDQVLVLHLQYADDTIFFGEWDKKVESMARWMRCGVGEFPFTYLGLPIRKKEQIIKKKAYTILSFQSELASREIKRSLDANKDIDVDEVSIATESVFDIDESNVESMKVCSKFGEFLENKKSMKEVVVGDGEALGVDEDESNRVSVLKDEGCEFDDSLDEINLGLSEEFVIRVLEGRYGFSESLVVFLNFI
nr:transposon TX1 [Tanacetum cinerariifolium]